MTLKTILLIYIAVMSLILFFMMGSDKHKAKAHKRRTPEAQLFLFAFLGGAVGGTLGMFFFHHKTLHWYFRYGFPLIAIAQLALVFIFA